RGLSSRRDGGYGDGYRGRRSGAQESVSSRYNLGRTKPHREILRTAAGVAAVLLEHRSHETAAVRPLSGRAGPAGRVSGALRVLQELTINTPRHESADRHSTRMFDLRMIGPHFFCSS